ncbi:MAG: Fur family transcriptional regulator [Tissierellaceae bacterium]|nr:Fur family transcriptional regulator [Tissierellaceae bacterium]
MKVNFDDLTKELKNKNIRLSHQRLKVLEFITNNRIHPTVDQIYSELHKDIPTLSKTTVYNSLNALIDVGLVKVITIEDNETRYDIVTDDHGHFKCESCGKIYDFEINLDSLGSKDLSNFKINNKDVYFKGICPECIKQ